LTAAADAMRYGKATADLAAVQTGLDHTIDLVIDEHGTEVVRALARRAALLADDAARRMSGETAFNAGDIVLGLLLLRAAVDAAVLPSVLERRDDAT